ncbi:YhfC family intramembrane metalloprotease [Candidatus Formimonas warabiya]|uniref:YhfC family intramembrane metalloprotease n=1 Tax=Formimonas warabiya TaxID=1761012 RepID=A0A3G1KMS0_FORW1|nr:YhfC family intramembrane metalloprotease [Candidatus Formimonas warabiya]ATW23772.1 hypothetical protein DCMF_02255 [Candidatus Formimonas warabiya]
MVSGASIAAMVFSLLISVGLPVAFLTYFRLRYKISFKAVGVGILVFIIFTQILEKLMHLYFLKYNVSTVQFLKNPLAYAVYGCLAAGIFEECGRFVAFKFLLKKVREWKGGIAYGIGHGGVEAIFTGMFAGINQLVNSILINRGLLDKLAAKLPGVDISRLKEAMISAPSYTFAVVGYERAMAFLLQIALSLLVLYGVKNGKSHLLLLAILLHAAVDFPAALYQKGALSLLAVEGILLAAGIISAVFITRSRKVFDRE